jgi:hypothetical protein
MRRRDIDFGEFRRKFDVKTKVIAAALKSRALTAKFRACVDHGNVNRFSKTRGTTLCDDDNRRAFGS